MHFILIARREDFDESIKRFSNIFGSFDAVIVFINDASIVVDSPLCSVWNFTNLTGERWGCIVKSPARLSFVFLSAPVFKFKAIEAIL